MATALLTLSLLLSPHYQPRRLGLLGDVVLLGVFQRAQRSDRAVLRPGIGSWPVRCESGELDLVLVSRWTPRLRLVPPARHLALRGRRLGPALAGYALTAWAHTLGGAACGFRLALPLPPSSLRIWVVLMSLAVLVRVGREHRPSCRRGVRGARYPLGVPGALRFLFVY